MCSSDRSRRADSDHMLEGVWKCPQVPKTGSEWPKFGLTGQDPLNFFFKNLTEGTQHYATRVSFWCWFRISTWICLKMANIVKKWDFMKKIGRKCIKAHICPPAPSSPSPNHIQSIANDVSYILNKKKIILIDPF